MDLFSASSLPNA